MTLVATCLTAKGCVALPIKKQMAKDLMTSPAITVQESATLKEIAALLTARKVNRVPVVDAAGKLIGIVSQAEISFVLPSGERKYERHLFARKTPGIAQSPALGLVGSSLRDSLVLDYRRLR